MNHRDTKPQSQTRTVLRASVPLWPILCLVFGGCVSAPLHLENSARLIARPDFTAAKSAAPEWCRDALKTINALEAQLESK